MWHILIPFRYLIHSKIPVFDARRIVHTRVYITQIIVCVMQYEGDCLLENFIRPFRPDSNNESIHYINFIGKSIAK